ncbi:MAG: DUF1552 domain-containing protein [Planctomycetes bacterium]|nr:DUF1552 domain-containing protein [Planctomycetota bacterium]MCB9890868.1 DUF1552 domain-containing protein [Planctomycetota bacterium]
MPHDTLVPTRRTFLRGLGVTCAVPFLDSLAWAGLQEKEPKKRLCFVYFPNGCSLPSENDAKYAHWRWFPSGEGDAFRFTKVLESLEPFRSRLSVLGGLSHPLSRELLGHLAGDTWLTGGDVRGDRYQNTISVDQVAAHHLKAKTRYPSLILSTDGGVGYKSRVATLSFDRNGHPIPAESRPRQIFERYFAPDGGNASADRKRSLQRGRKIVDLVQEDGKALRQRLGTHDQRKLDEYLESLNKVEEQIQRNEQWLDVPMPPVDANAIALDQRADVDPTAYLRTMFDLVTLAFQTDLTRVVTFMTGREDGMGFGDQFPNRALSIKRGLHTISHDTHEGHWDDWGRYDQWVAQQFAYFLSCMAATSDDHGSLLDQTMTLYGSCCSTTHNARNYPLVLAGGSALGLKHGRYHRWDEKTPLSNLFVTLLQQVGVPTKSFADSTGSIDALTK